MLQLFPFQRSMRARFPHLVDNAERHPAAQQWLVSAHAIELNVDGIVPMLGDEIRDQALPFHLPTTLRSYPLEASWTLPTAQHELDAEKDTRKNPPETLLIVDADKADPFQCSASAPVAKPTAEQSFLAAQATD